MPDDDVCGDENPKVLSNVVQESTTERVATDDLTRILLKIEW